MSHPFPCSKSMCRKFCNTWSVVVCLLRITGWLVARLAEFTFDSLISIMFASFLLCWQFVGLGLRVAHPSTGSTGKARTCVSFFLDRALPTGSLFCCPLLFARDSMVSHGFWRWPWEHPFVFVPEDVAHLVCTRAMMQCPMCRLSCGNS